MVLEAGREKKLPPHDIEAEEAVIASLLVDPEAIYRVAPTLKPEDFFREKNAWAFEACLALSERNQSINQITVAHELARRGRLGGGGGGRRRAPGDDPRLRPREGAAGGLPGLRGQRHQLGGGAGAGDHDRLHGPGHAAGRP